MIKKRTTHFSDVKLGGAIEGAIKGANEGAIEGAIEIATKGVKDKLAILLGAIAANEGNRVPDSEFHRK